MRGSSGGISPSRYAPVECDSPGTFVNGCSVFAAPPIGVGVLDDDDAQASAREERGRHQAVVASAHDHDISTTHGHRTAPSDGDTPTYRCAESARVLACCPWRAQTTSANWRLALPHVQEIPSEGFDFRVGGKGFVWSYPEPRPGKPRVIRTDIAVLFVGDEAEKQALLLGEPDLFFTTSGYDGWPLVMLRLTKVDADRLAELITDAWRMRAPESLVADAGDRSDGWQ